jgi:hypothetical protein
MELPAGTVLPAADLARTTSGPHGQLLRPAIATATAGLPDWNTRTVDGPTDVAGPAGRRWVRSTATVRTRPARV